MLGRVRLERPAPTPNGDGRADTLGVTVPLTLAASTVRILRDGAGSRRPSAAGRPGDLVVSWDGRKRLGKALDGTYVVSVEATDGLATATLELPFLLDGTAPAVRVVSSAHFASGLGARDARHA